jgi:hypothetical protein
MKFTQLIVPILTASAVVFSTASVANVSDAQKFNEIAAEILAPLNTNHTEVSANATELVFDENRLTRLSLGETFVKTGKFNKFAFLGQIDFEADSTEMKVNFVGGIDLNLPVAFGQQTLNEYAPGLADYAKQIVADATETYGDNIEISARTFDDVYDDDQNIVSLKFEASVEIALDNLDPELLQNTFLKSADVLVAFTREGLTMDASVELNPEYYYFKDQKWLKNYFTKILEKDPDTVDRFYSLYEWLDGAIQNIVDTKAE